jgi:lipopolysaccharide export system protein LptA
MITPRFYGQSSDGRPFIITARSAVRDENDLKRVFLDAPTLTLGVGSPAPTRSTADRGVYREDTLKLQLYGNVRMDDGAGYRFASDEAWSTPATATPPAKPSCKAKVQLDRCNPTPTPYMTRATASSSGAASRHGSTGRRAKRSRNKGRLRNRHEDVVDESMDGADGDRLQPVERPGSVGGGAMAQTPPAGGNNSSAPVDISADEQEVINSQCKTIFRGAVEVLQDKARMRAATMTVYNRRKVAGQGLLGPGGNADCGDVDRVEADGNVFYVTPEQTVRGDHAVYDYATDTVVVTGDVVASRARTWRAATA